ncbi:hypothetical protein GGR02_001200 [Anoxybacillus voinovskiensis]|uniref:GAF domain-containing protein n=1 Tax=Anoxybacteroides voinovskiense TaxID=230470 RepID=A0A840DTU1_9BACL|nr:hypothetical protein [Anoxybacillus voinovskiensis]MBB4073438.1 hypothetical protein [Anoxybacillus voinovskiensis]GGJ61178.1 hypothetical protein GCM10008982_07910 [Anoxybacillus voinovskiensis]
MELEKLLQNIQDAYASLLNCTVVIVNQSFIPVTRASKLNDFTKHILLTSRITNDFSRLRRTMLVSTDIPGVKVLIAPIKIYNETSLFIWAGAFMEKGEKQWVESSLKNQQLPSTSCFPEEITLDDMQEKLEYIEQMAYTCQQILETNKHKGEYVRHFQWLNEAVQPFSKKNFDMETSLNILPKLDSSIEFAAYAQKINENKFLIKYTVGEEIKKWKQTPLKDDELFVKWFLENGKPLVIENASTHLLLPSFLQQLKPLLFFAYPLMLDDELAGILLAGSFHKKFFTTITTKKTMQIAMNVASLRLQYEKAMSAVDRHLMRLSMLNDMGSIIDNAKKWKNCYI